MSFLNVLGNPAKTTFLAIEKEKISVEFTAGAAIKVGQAVKLGTDGKVTVWAKTDAITLLIGYAYNEATADGDLITVFTRGFAILFVMVSGNLTPGLGTVSSYDSSTQDDNGNTGYVVYEQAGSNTPNAWLLDDSTAAGDIVRALLMD